MNINCDYAITFRCRDIGYGVEAGEGVYTFSGRESLANKLILTERYRGQTIYLFDDEIETCEPYTVVRLVCPDCNGTSIGTIERAYIWQSATFEHCSDGAFGETADGKKVEIEWTSYDTDDVGDTETVGYFCRDCANVWENAGGRPDFVPFVPAP